MLVEGWHAEGSFARVYRGKLAAGGRVVAVKAARPEIAGSGVLLAAEADLLSRVNHGCVVRLLDRGEEGGSPFLLLEWLDGPHLGDYISAGRRLSVREALGLTGRILEAVLAFEAAGARHGDVRRENVLATPRGAVLIDPLSPVALEGVPPPVPDGPATGRLLYHLLCGESLDGQPFLALRGVPPAVNGIIRDLIQLEPVPLREARVRVARILEAL